MVQKQDFGFREVEGAGGGGGHWMVHGRCSVKLVLGTGGMIPCHERC